MVQAQFEDYIDVIRRELKALPWADIRPAAALLAGIGLWVIPTVNGRVDPAYRLLGTGSGLVLTLIADRTYSKRSEEAERKQRRQRAIEETEDDIIQTILVSASAANIGRLEQRIFEGLPDSLKPAHLLSGSVGEQEKDPWVEELGGAIDAFAQQALAPEAQTQLPGGQSVPAQSTSIAGELDLAREAAESDMSLLLSAPSGVGKTSFIRRFLHAANTAHPDASFDVIDFKGITGGYCGLENTTHYIKSGASGRDFTDAVLKIRSVVGMLDSKEPGVPYYLLCDEINNGLKQAGLSEDLDGKDPEKTFKAWLSYIVTQGRERDIRGVFTAHGNLMQLIGIDGDTAQSLVCAVLGRRTVKGDGFSLIPKAIKNDVFVGKDERPALMTKFDRMKAVADRDGRAIAFTNITGAWDLFFLPADYAREVGDLSWGEQNQSITRLIASTKPVEPPPAPPAEPRGFTLSDQDKELAASLFAWLKGDGAMLRSADGWFDADMVAIGWRELEQPQFYIFVGKLQYAGLLEIEMTQGGVTRPGRFRAARRD